MSEIAYSKNPTALLTPPSPEPVRAVELPLSQMAALLSASEDSAPLEDCDIVAVDEIAPASAMASSAPSASAPRVSSEPPKFVPLRRSFPIGDAEERAPEIELPDLSLRLDNPLRASSLVPPTTKRFGTAFRVTLGTVLAGVICSLAAFSYRSEAPRVAQVVAPSHGIAAPAPPSEPVLAASAVVPKPPTSVPAAVEIPRAFEAVPSPVPTERPAARRERHETQARQHAPRGKRSRQQRAAIAAPTAGADLSTASHDTASSRDALPAPQAPVAALGAAPSRADIIAMFGAARADLARCAAGASGIAEIHATILSSGRVSAPHIAGAFEGTPASKCMERSVRNLSVAPFAAPQRMNVVFPVAL